VTKGIARQRLLVLRSANAIWQRVVRRLAAVVDVVLIDISEPTQNLLWEIESLKRSRGPNWILVGRRDRVEAFAQRRGAADDNELTGQLLELLEGEQVLVCESEQRPAMQRFATAFRARLEQCSSARHG